jgi:hypothetical protein
MAHKKKAHMKHKMHEHEHKKEPHIEHKEKHHKDVAIKHKMARGR